VWRGGWAGEGARRDSVREREDRRVRGGEKEDRSEAESRRRCLQSGGCCADMRTVGTL